MKCNTRLKYKNTTPFLLNNYLLKCAQQMLDVFSTENLLIHHKILIGIKDQLDFHKLLEIFYENKTCILQLVFLLFFFFSASMMVKAEQMILLTKEEEYLVRHFPSNGVVNPCIDWVSSRANVLLTKII